MKSVLFYIAEAQKRHGFFCVPSNHSIYQATSPSWKHHAGSQDLLLLFLRANAGSLDVQCFD